MNLRQHERLVFAIGEGLPKPADGKPVFKQTSWNEAPKLNLEQWGIFWTVNFFNGDRANKNLKEFFAWYAEFDDGDKKSQAERISQYLEPSMVIESKNGYHVYYFAEKDQPVDDYNIITTSQIIPALKCDKSVRDLARVLRVPNYFHWKDPKNPFEIKIVYYTGHKYSVEDIKLGFPVKTESHRAEITKQEELKRVTRDFGSDKLWERIYNFDCEQALVTLSGSSAVNGERFSFYRVSRNRKNIVVDGKSTNCFIDEYGRIGSQSKGGPTIWQWVNWYQNDHKKTYQYLKEYFPSLFEGA